MQIVRSIGLWHNKEKCKMRQSEVSYFGHLVGRDEIKPHPEKSKAISELQPPCNVSKFRTVLGMFNYLGKFLPHFSMVLKPVIYLLKVDTSWQWQLEQKTVFKKAKEMISHATTLTYYNQSLPTSLSADSSSFGLGGVIMQEHDGWLKPVTFCSRTLTPAEQIYAMIEKECLALVSACEHFTQYLTGIESFTLLIDHKSLVPIR